MSQLFEKAVPNPHGYRDAGPLAVHGASGVRWIDVREPSEFVGELGHIDGAELVPQATLGTASVAWDKSETIVVICRSGGRSARAARLLAIAGFEKVINLAGGMQEWNRLGLPTASVRDLRAGAST